MPSTRVYLALLLLCYYVSWTSGRSIIARTEPDESSQDEEMPDCLEDDEENWATPSESESEFEKALDTLTYPEHDAKPGTWKYPETFDCVLDPRYLSHCLLPLPERRGVPTEARFINEDSMSEEGRRYSGIMIIHWTTKEPFLYGIPGVLLHRVYTEEGYMTESLLPHYNKALSDMLSTKLLDAELRAVTVWADFDRTDAKRWETFRAILFKFQDTVIEYKKDLNKDLIAKAGFVRASSASGRDLRVKCTLLQDEESGKEATSCRLERGGTRGIVQWTMKQDRVAGTGQAIAQTHSYPSPGTREHEIRKLPTGDGSRFIDLDQAVNRVLPPDGSSGLDSKC